MVAAARESNPATSQPSPEDEAAKRNTDCVYFLASPLTCKKGSECEYRHSEYARVNPRDCYYWLNGSCLNPKCPFRHPPLDGLLGTPTAASGGSALPSPQVVASAPAANFQSKQGVQGVPCIFYQKGNCLKGDYCTFLHGPNTAATKPPQLAPVAPETLAPKSMFGVPQRTTQDSKFSQAMVSNSTQFPVSNPVPKLSNAHLMTHRLADKSVIPSRGLNDGSLKYNSATVAPPPSGSSVQMSNRVHDPEMSDDQIMHNGKDADDLYRESSPGFDVLVDDEIEEDQFYDKTQYGTKEARQARNVNNYDIGHSTDYGTMSDADPDVFRDPRGYDYYERGPGQYSRDQGRRSSERISRGSNYVEGRSDHKGGSADTNRISHSDLRYRLKQRKGSGLRSVISSDYARDTHNEQRSSDYRRESRHLSPRERSLSSRFQGRIKDPRRSPPPLRGSERERSRVSPGRNQIRERIGTRAQEDFRNERILGGYGMRRDGSEDDRVEFSGPKRLSEIKACKNSVKDRLMSGQESFSLGKRKSNEVHDYHESDLSFDGPKPLSEILKRKKRSEEIYNGGSGALDKENFESGSIEKSVSDKADGISVSETKTEVVKHMEASEEGAMIELEEDGVIGDEGMEDQEWEGYEQEGEYGEEYYEEDGGEYNLEEGENAEGGEYVDEEDGDGGFEKKADAILS